MCETRNIKHLTVLKYSREDILMKYQTEIQQNTLKESRITLGLRQQDVADILGHSITDRISHWEKGRAMPSLINLFKLSAVYGKMPHELYPVLLSTLLSDKRGIAN